MSFFAQATPPSKPRTKNIQAVSLLAAGIITIMAVTQLFTFEDLPAVISALWLPGGAAMAQTIAAVLVVIEVVSLPFLLSLQLSIPFRYVSMAFGWCVAAVWITLALWENLMMGTISNSGILGATIPLPAGWWSVLFSIALAILVAWASWGMWPVSTQKLKK